MTITFNCPSCLRVIDAAPELAGAVADCPHCGTAVNVPELPKFEKPSEWKRIELAMDNQAGILSAILHELASQTKQLDSIRRMILWFYATAILAIIFSIIQLVWHSFIG